MPDSRNVNSTVACSITAKNNEVKVIHVEGGIRSWDKSMQRKNKFLLIVLQIIFLTSGSQTKTYLSPGLKR